jgi:MerR family transcriptional regulator, redox-sensitive transcriptional activator SoxR
MNANDIVSIGALAARTGVSISAIRFYETKGLIAPFRSSGKQRRYLRSDIRRLSFIRIAQAMGLSIEDIGVELSKLPHGRTPTVTDWANISTAMRAMLDDKITIFERTRDRLDGCIGCGCLSLKNCALYNPQDKAGAEGAGPRFISGVLPL